MSKVWETIGGITSTAAAIGLGYLGYMSLDTFSEQVLSGGIDYWSNGTGEGVNSSLDAADGNTPALTTVFGLLSSVAGSSGGGGDVIEIFTRNAKAYSETEMKAKEIYDNYNSSHEKEKDQGTSLIAKNPEIASLVNNILNSSSKQELIMKLSTLEYVLNQSKKETTVESKSNQYTLK